MDHQTKQSVYVGIDVAKDKLDVYFSHTKKHMQVKNDENGFEMILNVLPANHDALVVLEPTAGYEKPVARYLTMQGIAVSIQNARLIRNHAKSLGLLAKTDKIDAFVIAHFAEARNVLHLYGNNEDQEYLQQLVRRRKNVVEMLNAEKNRKKQVIQTRIVASLERTITYLKEEIRQLEVEMDNFISTHEMYHEKSQILSSIPGVGKISAYAILAEAPELGVCDCKEIAMLGGLAPINCDSGKMKGKRMIWGGRKEIRSALYMVALVAMRHNPLIKEFADRLRSYGKKGQTIIVACMRKLLVIMNSMIRNQTCWLERKETASKITVVS
jgi:transposase